MKDVLDINELPFNMEVPVVCMDEKPYQLLGEVRASWFDWVTTKKLILNTSEMESAVSLHS